MTEMTNMNSPKSNKMMLIGGGVVLALLIIVAGIFAYSKMNSKTTDENAQPTTKKKVVAPTNVIPVAERPYVEIDPVDARNIQIVVNTTKKDADSVDYEIEYQTESSLEGAQGNIELGTLPATAKVLLGSCSAGGACRYHTGVVGGTVLLKFNGAANYSLKQEWNYLDNSKKGTQFSSKDAKFQIDSKDLATQQTLIIYNSPGFPGELPGTPISDPYSITGLSALKGKAELTMRATEEAANAEIMGWDGKAWKAFTSKVDGKTVTASVDLMPLYIVVKK